MAARYDSLAKGWRLGHRLSWLLDGQCLVPCISATRLGIDDLMAAFKSLQSMLLSNTMNISRLERWEEWWPDMMHQSKIEGCSIAFPDFLVVNNWCPVSSQPDMLLMIWWRHLIALNLCIKAISSILQGFNYCHCRLRLLGAWSLFPMILSQVTADGDARWFERDWVRRILGRVFLDFGWDFSLLVRGWLLRHSCSWFLGAWSLFPTTLHK